ncbi:hypothetical protein MW887_004161 [Aspergillus wentii]|nr:hypothetical protein MW887_004161 [Aspergillus wentii]
MGSNRRQSALTKSIQSALFRDSETFKKTVTGQFLAFFSIFYIRLLRYGKDVFWKLRHEAWEIDEEEYKVSFQTQGKNSPLKPMGDLGYSGSTFFSTSNSKFLVKSLPRHFEHSFFREDLLRPYCDHMRIYPDSLLVWITDYVYAPYKTIGGLLRFIPAHHIIMENLLYGKDEDPAAEQWETFDLKPVDYFYPERDLVPEPLVSEETIHRLGDRFEDKIRLRRADYEDLKRTLEIDTKFLQSANTVDYSLFLVRFPASSQPDVVGRKDPWRVGFLCCRWTMEIQIGAVGLLLGQAQVSCAGYDGNGPDV